MLGCVSCRFWGLCCFPASFIAVSSRCSTARRPAPVPPPTFTAINRTGGISSLCSLCRTAATAAAAAERSKTCSETSPPCNYAFVLIHFYRNSLFFFFSASYTTNSTDAITGPLAARANFSSVLFSLSDRLVTIATHLGCCYGLQQRELLIESSFIFHILWFLGHILL